MVHRGRGWSLAWKRRETAVRRFVTSRADTGAQFLTRTVPEREQFRAVGVGVGGLADVDEFEERFPEVRASTQARRESFAEAASPIRSAYGPKSAVCTKPSSRPPTSL
jgi:hypothetical protein